MNELLAFIRERAHWVEPDIRMSIARDPADDKFLEAAVCGGASIVVSSDRDLLDLEKVKDISIVPSREFAE